MGLANIVFSNNEGREIEVGGHKMVVRKLTAADSLELETDLGDIAKDDVSIKEMLRSTIDILSSVIVSVDGVASDSKADAKAFLLKLEQSTINDIFNKAQVYGETTNEEIKK